MSEEIRAQVSRLSKDANLIATLMRLAAVWGDHAFDVLDHWEANLHGIGVAQKANHSVLVYIDNFGKAKDTYNVELEIPPLPGSGQPFKSAGVYDGITFEELSTLVGRHLGLENTKLERRAD